jgi:hypothetical protein
VDVTEVYQKYDNTDLMPREYVQIALKNCIHILKEEGLLFPVTSDRRPYFRMDTQNSRNGKIQTRSVNRVIHSSAMIRYGLDMFRFSNYYFIVSGNRIRKLRM